MTTALRRSRDASRDYAAIERRMHHLRKTNPQFLIHHSAIRHDYEMFTTL